MAKLNRRQVLKTGLAAGAFITTTQAAHPTQAAQVSFPQPVPDRQLISQAGGGGYDRQLSGLLVRCCDLAVSQYLASLTNRDFDGSIRDLELYREYASLLDQYTQVGSFRAAELNFSEIDNSPAIAEKLAERPAEQPQPVAISIREVFFGYALSSPTSNIIALRGTQTDMEWVRNIAARQVSFVNRQPQQGRVHQGFQLSYERIITQIRRVLPQFTPNVPCYITGHSLGGAVAILTAADLALDNTLSRDRIQVYTYASPRVGDPAFAQFYASMISQTYRVTNLADMIPIVPPETVEQKPYAHVGQEWSYLSQFGSIAANHAIGTYREAIDARVEVSQPRSYPVSGL